MNSQLLIQLLILIFSGLPLSLIVIRLYIKFFSKYNPNLAKIDTICTPITGSLTKNLLSVRSLIFDDHKVYTDHESRTVSIENAPNKDPEELKKNELQQFEAVQLVAITISLCHYGKLEKIEQIISSFFKQCELFTNVIKNKHSIIAEIPTNDEKKISTVVAIKEDTEEIFSYSKGNPYKILERCSRIFADGRKLTMDHQTRRKYRDRVKSMNKRGEKVIAFAYKPLPKKRFDSYSEQFTENDLVFLGLVGIGDSLNEEIIPVIEELQENDLKIYVISRDIERKTVAAAQQLKIANPSYCESVTGNYLNSLNEQKLSKMLSNRDKDYIFSEIDEDQKERIVKTLRNNGQTIAMAQRNKDSIKRILDGIKFSRKNKTNYSKLKFHALTSKIAQVSLAVAAIALQTPPALALGLVIAFDLLINLPLELALNSTKIPKKSKPSFITTGIIVSVFLLAFYFWQLLKFGWQPGENFSSNPSAITSISSSLFLLLLLIQIYNSYRLFNKKFYKQQYLNLTIIITLLLSYSIINFRIFQDNFQTSTISGQDFYVILFIFLIYLILEQLRNKFARN